MKILVICQHYYPEPFRVSDICEELVNRGHEVTVVTGVPNYPMGTIYDGYEDCKKMDEVINGVKVHRCPIHPRKKSVLHRVANYYSYSYKSTKYINKIDVDFDLVFIYQLSPVMMAQAGIEYAKQHGKKVILYCLDLWPESLVVGGIPRNSVTYKYYHRKSKNIYKAVDQILVTSKSFKEYFINEFGISNVLYLPQYAEDIFTPQECYKIPDEYIDLMFAGNVGTAQSVETIIKTSILTKDITKLRWHIVGDGKEIKKIKKLAEEADAPVIFHGRKTIDEMPIYYKMADAMLVTMQKNPVLSLTLPGKVQSYMAAAKPIIGAIDGETKKIVSEAQCGYIAQAENSLELEKEVRKFIENENKDTLGINGRNFYEYNFTKNGFMDELEKQFAQ